jgi:ribosome-associated translation inhibitor RaiA
VKGTRIASIPPRGGAIHIGAERGSELAGRVVEGHVRRELASPAGVDAAQEHDSSKPVAQPRTVGAQAPVHRRGRQNGASARRSGAGGRVPARAEREERESEDAAHSAITVPCYATRTPRRMSRGANLKHFELDRTPGDHARRCSSIERRPLQSTGAAVASRRDMTFPVVVTFRGIESSDPIASYVRRRADKLSMFDRYVLGCRVAVEAPHRHKTHGRHYRVRIELAVAGPPIVVDRCPDEGRTNEDAYAAIDEAFDHAARRLRARSGRLRARRMVAPLA